MSFALFFLLPIVFLCFKIYVIFWREKIKRNISNTAVLVTGCDTGFGRLTAIKLYELGVTVFAACLSSDSIPQLEALNKSSSNRIIPFQLDVTKPNQVKEAFHFVSTNLSSDISNFSVINNAGVLDGYLVEFTPLEVFQKCVDVNYLGVVSVTKTFLPLIRKFQRQPGGRVITIVSIAGRAAPARVSAYSASKFAVEAFSDCLRVELKSYGIDIPIVMIEPTFARTQMVNDLTPILSKFIQPDPSNTERSDLIANYGGTERLRTATSDYVDFATSSALSVETVVETIVHSYTVATPKIRYVVGAFAHFLAFVTLLPAEVSDALQVFGSVTTSLVNQRKRKSE